MWNGTSCHFPVSFQPMSVICTSTLIYCHQAIIPIFILSSVGCNGCTDHAEDTS